MVDVTAFSRVQPAIKSTGLAGIAAIQAGKEDRRVEEDRTKEKQNEILGREAFDAWKSGQKLLFQRKLGELSASDPDSASKMMNIFGTLDRTNFVESAYHLYNAARSDNEEAINTSLDRAIDTLNVRPNHPMIESLKELRAMPFGTDEEKEAKYKKLLLAVDTADEWNAYPRQEDLRKKSATAPTPTDVDDYVRRASEQYFLDTGKIMPPGMRNKAALEYKRAQAEEVRKTREARKIVDANYEGLIKKNGELGIRLAQIATNPALIESKGELTPIQQRNIAKTRMTNNLVELARNYNDLSSMGAIIDTDNNSMDNIFAAMSSSSAGQAIGRVFGTKSQSVRARINKIIPLVVQDIRQSTNMSARGLDSEKELEFYVQTATDPKTDLQSNLAGIAVLDEAYGDGKVAKVLRESGSIDLEALNRIQARGREILQGVGKPQAAVPGPTAGAPPAAAQPQAGTQQNPAKPTTQEDFDALPAGSYFIDPDDGKLYTK